MADNRIFKVPGLGHGTIELGFDLYKTWFVDSNNGDSGASGKTPRQAVTTILLATAKASAGDTIHLMEGHAEELAAATEFAVSLAGVKVIGHGRGSRRPTLTLTGTGSNVPISGDSVELHNMLFTISGTTDVLIGITVTGDDVLLKDIELRQPTTTDEFVDAITLTGCDRIRIEDFVYDGAAQGGAGQTAIHITDAVERPYFKNLWIVGDFATGAIQNEGAAMVDVFFHRLFIQNIHATAACLTVHANTTGILDYARFRVGTDDQSTYLAALTVSNKLQIFDLMIVNADGEVGVAAPVSDLDVTNVANNHWGNFSIAED